MRDVSFKLAKMSHLPTLKKHTNAKKNIENSKNKEVRKQQLRKRLQERKHISGEYWKICHDIFSSLSLIKTLSPRMSVFWT